MKTKRTKLNLPASISKSAGVWMSVSSPPVDKVLSAVGSERRPFALLLLCESAAGGEER